MDEDASCISQFHNTLVRSMEQQKFIALFKSKDLFGQRGLADVQLVSGPRKTQLLSHGNDSAEKSCFDIKVRCSTPFLG